MHTKIIENGDRIIVVQGDAEMVQAAAAEIVQNMVHATAPRVEHTRPVPQDALIAPALDFGSAPPRFDGQVPIANSDANGGNAEGVPVAPGTNQQRTIDDGTALVAPRLGFERE